MLAEHRIQGYIEQNRAHDPYHHGVVNNEVHKSTIKYLNMQHIMSELIFSRVRGLLSAALVLILLSTAARADRYTFLGNYVSHDRDASGITVQAKNNVLRLSIVGDAVLRIQVGRDGTLLNDASFAVQHEALPAVSWELDDTDSALVLRMPGGTVDILKEPLRLVFRDAEGREIASDDRAFGHAWDGKEIHVWKTLHPDERFYGLGEKTGDINKRGNQWVMWNSDIPGYGNDRDPLYASVPFFIGVRDAGAYGIYFDNSFRSVFNLGAASDRVYSFGAEDGEMDYYFFFGPAVRDVVQRYAGLTGRMPLPPMWALGFQQCRWNYFPEFEVRDLAKNFRQRRIPADVLYLDIMYMERYKVFTWDSTAFPNPAALLSDLEGMGFKVVPIIDPGIKIERGYDVYEQGVSRDHFLKYPDGALYSGQVWPGWCHFPDFSREDTRRWWGDYYGRMMDLGIDGFWNDMNEPAVWGREFPYLVEFDNDGEPATIKRMHNVYAHLEAEASFSGMRRSNPAKRPFVLTRAAFAGTQRYAAIWTGDNTARFDDLRMGIRMCLGLGLSGMPFNGTDIGGFMDSPSPELYIRWLQAGVFTPLMRSHSHINTRDQEPWSFGEETEMLARRFISLRYEFLPYIYTAFHQASLSGMPMMRPLLHDFQNDPAVYDNRWQHTWMFGEHILVAPVVGEGQRFQEVYLPEGRWVDPWTGASYEGRQRIIVDAPLDRLPLFYRAGAIIPRRRVQQFTGEKALDTLVLDIVPQNGGSGTLYLDGGDGYGYENGEFDLLRFSLGAEERGWRLTVDAPESVRTRSITAVRLRLFGSDVSPRRVTLGDRVIFDTDANTVPPDARFDTGHRRFEITIPFTPGVSTVTIGY